MKADELTGPTLGNSGPDGSRTQSPESASLNDRESGPRGGSCDPEKGGEISLGSSSTDGDEFNVKWDGPEDPESPRSMSTTKKWICTVVVSLGSLCV